ncbi:MAG TPA: AAA family ATPase, partial [Coriobacteriia bacterium]|nr:AAA family ATPase [Coriobacteriia bacterium]
MRLVSLQLAPYGALTDLVLQLAPGVMVVHGPNEAGKSTVLSAYSDLLCGIHPRTSMAFRTPRKNLRIHASLTLDDGTVVSITRTPLTSPRDLLDSATSEPVDDALRTALTSALDNQVLRTRFGLDHDHLIAGGKALVDGSGDLAPIVFEARAGADVRTLADALQKRVDGLFKSRRNASSKVTDAAARLAELKAHLAETMATAEAVETAERQSNQANTRREEARGDATRARQKHGRLSLLAESWPFWEQYQTLTAALDELDAEG